MPLRDHFRPPVNLLATWDALHGGWPMVIVQQLRKRLPQGYVAAPTVHPGSQIEIDVATFEKDDAPRLQGAGEAGGVATAVWAPPEPALAVETDVPDDDAYEVRIYDVQRGRQLVTSASVIRTWASRCRTCGSPDARACRDHEKAPGGASPPGV